MSSLSPHEEIRTYFDAAVFEATAEGCVVADNDLIIVYANAAVGAMIDCAPEDLIGRHVTELAAPESRAEVEYQSNLRDLMPQRMYEGRMMRADGSRLFVVVNASRLYNTEGKPIGSFAFITDITRHHRDQVILQQQRQQLRTTIQLLSRRYEGVCRDMRDPLNALLGVPEMLRTDNRSPPGEMDDFLGLCRDAGEQILRLVENLSTWTRLQLDQITLEPGNYELDEIVRDALEPYTRADDRHGRRVVNLVGPLRVRTDLHAAYSILQHLTDNALRFSPDGGEVELTAEAVNGHVAVTIRDQGPGIPADQQPHLFRLDQPQRRPDSDGQQGSGFGLLICRTLVERMGGTISVASRPGAGTGITFTLPAATVQ